MFILQKELLLMGELQRQYQEKLEGIDNQCTEKEKRQDYVNTLEAEMKGNTSFLTYFWIIEYCNFFFF